MNDGDIIAWFVFDPDTLELVMRCVSRAEARLNAGDDGEIAALVRKH